MANAKTSLYRHPLFTHMVRMRLADKLVSELGYDRRSAMEAVAGLPDDSIHDAAVHAAGPEPKVGAGGIIQAILDFLSGAGLGKLIAFLLSLFGLATPAPTPDPVPPADPTP